VLLRLPYTFKSAIFFKFRFFGQSNDLNEISNVKKKTPKKSENLQIFGDFTFWPEVKITRLIEIFNAVFSNQFFPLRHCKELKLKGIFSDCPHIIPVGRLTYKAGAKVSPHC